VLARTWQMLLKGLEEVQVAPSPIQAAEMVLVRLAYVADLPAPAELIRSIVAPGSATPPPRPGNGVTAGQDLPVAEPPSPRPAPTPTVAAAAVTPPTAGSALRLAVEPAEPDLPAVLGSVECDPMPQTFGEVIALFDKRREALIRAHLREHVHLIAFEPGRIEFRPTEGAPSNLANRVSQLLSEWTGNRWLVACSEQEGHGEPTLREQEECRERELRNEVAAHPLVRAVLETFPGAMIAAVRDRLAPSEPEVDEISSDEPGDEVNLGEEGS
jgi:DNA polymerase III subunit gamma/tau